VDKTLKNSAPSGATPDAERRRIGTVVHDERGNASISWRDAPAHFVERPVLEVLGEPKLTLKNEHDEACDPYARRSVRDGGNTSRTDLRKLSEWIKMMRDLEERKRGGEGEE